jgi:hypothetical protein
MSGEHRDDGVVVYRATREHVLAEVGAVLTEAGIPVLLLWRQTTLPLRSRGAAPGVHGEGEAVVPAAQAARARELIALWEAQGEARIREHLKELPGQLRPIGIAVGIVVMGIYALWGPTWTDHSAGMFAFAALVTLLLVAFEIPARMRRRRERAERARFSDDQPPRWFER